MGHRTTRSNAVALVLLLVAPACGGSSDATVSSNPASGGTSSSADAGAVDGSSSNDSGFVGQADAAASDGSAAADASHPTPADAGLPSKVPIPKPVGACPTFQNGTVTFNPAAGPRTVQLFLDPTTLSKHGPLVLYWYATYGSPAQATQALGSSLQTIESLGGIVAAPVDNGTGQFPWIDNEPAHMLLADEIVGCAAAIGVDTTHIHALGFSAGALMTTALSFGRSAYLASVATYSGGLVSGAAPAYEDATNKFAALILTGGTTDNVFNTDFQKASLAYQSQLKTDGHSALYCDHGGGHTIPAAYTAAVGRFFLDHPFGTNPSPYVGALPAALKSCTF
jgi:predicted esterase